MQDISQIKRELEQKFARKFCKVPDVDRCPHSGECTCRIAAEIKAHVRTVLPEPFYNLSFKDFTGRDKQGKRLISDDVALGVKQKIISYCWRKTSLGDLVGPNKLSHKALDGRSLMDIRRERGDNVIIYGDSGIGTDGARVGKTFIASLIIQEAIKRRRVPGHDGDSYDWQNFRTLFYQLKQEDRNNGDASLVDTKYADWLVVDDIPEDVGHTLKSQQYISSMLDPFFSTRLSEKLPTIFVFRFDVMKPSVNIERSFGIAINKIFCKPRTFKISLCKRDGDI